MRDDDRPDISREVAHGMKRKETSESLAVILFLIVGALAWWVGSAVNKGLGIALLLIGVVVIWRSYHRR